MMEYVQLANFGFFAFLALVWSVNSWPNVIIKFGMISLMILNGVAAFEQFGYIVKAV